MRLSSLFTEQRLNSAYLWLCTQRRHFPPNADIWHLRAHWSYEKQVLLKELESRKFQFSPLEVIRTTRGETIHLWSSRDSLVLKMLALWLPGYLSLSSHCTHLKGHGGLKATVADIQKHVTHYHFVMRTDVKSYYASIDHYILLEQLSFKIKDKFVLNLLWRYMHRTGHYGGLYRDIIRGISRGCPLSPVIGAFYLHVLDDRLSSTGVYYVRYMDDILIMVESRWKLRRTVKILNSSLVELNLEKHPDKTFVGRLDKGFDFLGYHFSAAELSLADQTIQHFREHLHRLYEQQRAAPNRAALLGAYVIRWLRWTQAGLGNLYRASIPAQLATMVGYGWKPIRSNA